MGAGTGTQNRDYLIIEAVPQPIVEKVSPGFVRGVGFKAPLFPYTNQVDVAVKKLCTLRVRSPGMCVVRSTARRAR